MSEINSGERNPFFGKKHTEETRKRISDRDYSVNSSELFRKKLSWVFSGSRNPMYGRSIYDVWLKKYGEEEAGRRLSELKKRQSMRNRGAGNPMYGKPSPQGSGNGWSGWYKGWFFRSLKELSYVIEVLEKNGYKWRTAESKDLSIGYILDGESRTYFADFLVDDSILVEVKPKKLMESRRNVAKKEAALGFCMARGLSYRMVDVRVLEEDVIVDLYKKGIIKFTATYERKMEDRLKKGIVA
jgi:hypothetical protein